MERADEYKMSLSNQSEILTIFWPITANAQHVAY